MMNEHGSRLSFREALPFVRPAFSDPYNTARRMIQQFGDFIEIDARLPEPLRSFIGRRAVSPEVAMFLHSRYIIANPHDAELLLGKYADRVEKSTPDQIRLQSYGQESLLTLRMEDQWNSQRKALHEAFVQTMIPRYQHVVAAHTQELFSTWETEPDTNGTIVLDDIQHEFLQLTLKIIAEALFDYRLSDKEGKRLSQAFATGEDFLSRCARWGGIPWVFRDLSLPQNRERKRQINALNEIADRIIDTSAARTRFWQSMQGQTKSGYIFSRQEIRDNILAFLLAGHETTATGLTWAVIELSKPENVNHMESLVKQLRADPESTDSMPAALHAFEETLRLHPPGGILTRKAIADIPLDAQRIIPKGSYLAICVYLINRHPDYWSDPDRFDPDRFTTNTPSQHSPAASLSFGYGPRLCIGRQFGLMEGPYILSALLRRYDIKIPDAEAITPAVCSIMRPGNPIQTILTPISL